MNLTNDRNKQETNDCIGDFSVTDKFLCNTLQPPVGRKNDLGYEAMPAGRYTLIPIFSPKFGYIVPCHDVDITTQTDIDARRLEIHPLNDHHGTEGCTGLGVYDHEDWIANSKGTAENPGWWRIFMEQYFLPATRTKSLKLLTEQHNLNEVAQWELAILLKLPPQTDDFVTIDVIDNI